MKYNLAEARRLGHSRLLSFGGAYSNHIHALAGAGREYGFETVGVIRGEAYHPLNPTLQFAADQGMQLYYLCRADYRRKQSEEIIARLHDQFGDFYLIPEGGSNTLALKGCAELGGSIDIPFDFLVCACGTGATLAGLTLGVSAEVEVVGISVLKGGAFLNDEVRRFYDEAGLGSSARWRIEEDFHCGGYAKVTPELVRFIDQFEQRHAIALDPVYTGKMMAALYQMIEAGRFAAGSRIVVLHSGGLQGRMSGLSAAVRNC